MDFLVYVLCHVVLPVMMWFEQITWVQSLGILMCSILNYYAFFGRAKTKCYPEPLGTILAFDIFIIIIGLAWFNPTLFEFTF